MCYQPSRLSHASPVVIFDRYMLLALSCHYYFLIGSWAWNPRCLTNHRQGQIIETYGTHVGCDVSITTSTATR
ncbi:hypothetical protein BDZ85DRAFT_256550 [Elsinoe ampelina]|uniref:Uncharacterized protein n=1 Tax=Elsinoe ampelina TaxID=302913 RepID=A0A6A6GMB7_9PEZI|nr:hypothetical protein BDZ85DRAFT_256550 [Elsinoe ampelina]